MKNGRRPQIKNGRRPQIKNERRPKKLMENNLIFIFFKLKTTSKKNEKNEDDLKKNFP